jgi:hypothetical protein
LEDQALSIGRPISFGILTSVRELLEVTEMRVGGEDGSGEQRRGGA